MDVVASSRPVKALLLVDSTVEASGEVTLAFLELSNWSWGGWYSLVVPIADGIIKESWWPLLNAFCPDQVIQVGDMLDETSVRIDNELTPSWWEKADSKSYDNQERLVWFVKNSLRRVDIGDLAAWMSDERIIRPESPLIAPVEPVDGADPWLKRFASINFGTFVQVESDPRTYRILDRVQCHKKLELSRRDEFFETFVAMKRENWKALLPRHIGSLRCECPVESSLGSWKQGWCAPMALVIGSAVDDLSIYAACRNYAYQDSGVPAIWLPSWPEDADFAGRLLVCLESMSMRRKIVVTSASLEREALEKIASELTDEESVSCFAEAHEAKDWSPPFDDYRPTEPTHNDCRYDAFTRATMEQKRARFFPAAPTFARNTKGQDWRRSSTTWAVDVHLGEVNSDGLWLTFKAPQGSTAWPRGTFKVDRGLDRLQLGVTSKGSPSLLYTPGQGEISFVRPPDLSVIEGVWYSRQRFSEAGIQATRKLHKADEKWMIQFDQSESNRFFQVLSKLEAERGVTSELSTLIEHPYWRQQLIDLSGGLEVSKRESKERVTQAFKNFVKANADPNEEEIADFADELVHRNLTPSRIEIAVSSSKMADNFQRWKDRFKDEDDGYWKHRSLGIEEIESNLLKMLRTGLVYRGMCPICPSCRLKSWHPITELQPTLTCPGCQQSFEIGFGEEFDWHFKIDSLVADVLRSPSRTSHLAACFEFCNTRQSFPVFACEGTIAPPMDDKWAADIIGLRDGNLELWEAKSDPRSIKAKQVARYRKAAEAVGAQKVVFYVADFQRSAPVEAWDSARALIETEFDGSPVCCELLHPVPCGYG